MSIIRAHMQLIMQELEKRPKSKSRAEAEFFCLARGASRLLKYSTLQRYPSTTQLGTYSVRSFFSPRMTPTSQLTNTHLFRGETSNKMLHDYQLRCQK